MMKRLLLSIGLILASVSFSLAQSPVITVPYNSAISDNSFSINTTNTFQSVFPSSENASGYGRTQCIIQNLTTSSNKMWIYFGSPSNAITNNSIQLSAGDKFFCNNSGVVIRNQISITGTAGDRYFAIQQ